MWISSLSFVIENKRCDIVGFSFLNLLIRKRLF